MTAERPISGLCQDASRGVSRERQPMPAAKVNPLIRWMPSLTDVAFLLPIGFLFLVGQGARTMLGDGDTGWHVRTGEWILRNGRIPRTDFFSFTRPGQPWFAWEWLWDVAFGWLHQRWGLAAVIVASMMVLGVTFALLFRLILRKCPNPFVALGVTAFAAAGCSIHYLARPHLFTFLFVVVFSWILEAASEGRPRLLWWLPALMVVWTNVHGGFLIGLMMLATYAAGNLVSGLVETERNTRRIAFGQFLRFTLAGATSFAATFVNPYFYHLHVHIYQYLRDPQLYSTIQEFLPLTFRGYSALAGEPMFALAILAAAWNLYRRRFTYTFLVVAWACLGVDAARNLPIFLLLAAPVIGEMLGEALEKAKAASGRGWLRMAARRLDEISSEIAPLERIPRFHLTSAAVIALVAVVLSVPHASAKFRAEYDPSAYPAKALPVLRSEESQRIFTNDEWGDYLIYELHPVRNVFVDGRSDFYGPKFDEAYLDVMKVKFGWDKTLSKYGVDTILLPVDEPLAGALKLSQRWRVVYDDGRAIVFRSYRPSSTTASSIAGTRNIEQPNYDKGNQKATASRDSSPAKISEPRTRS